MAPTSSDRSDDGVQTAADLDAKLTALLREAYANGVEVQGSWVVQNEAATPDWEVLVTKLAKED